MPQSLARLHIHLIFSTKNRQSFLNDAIRESLHRYIATVVRECGNTPILINSVADHIHLLFDLSRTASVSDVVKEIKTSSSKWIKTQGPAFAHFAWQAGYGAFAVSASNVDHVRAYIENQNVHHRTITFQDEFRGFLERHGIEFDERYVWD